MNRFVIVEGLPYLIAGGKTFTCRFDENGFTMGAEVKLASVPSVVHSELSVMAHCVGNLDSIGAVTKPKRKKKTTGEQAVNTE